jgi:hypothetical protein
MKERHPKRLCRTSLLRSLFEAQFSLVFLTKAKYEDIPCQVVFGLLVDFGERLGKMLRILPYVLLYGDKFRKPMRYALLQSPLAIDR